MRRFLLAAMVVLPAAQAREVESGLAALRQRLQSHSVVQRNLSGLHQRATLASGTLAETAAALDHLEEPDPSWQLAYLRERLLTASRGLETDFASIEAKLAGLGLPEKTAAWREFVRQYRTRLAAVDGELAALAANSGGLSRSQLRTRLAALRTKLGSASVARASRGTADTGPARPPAGGLELGPAPPAADDAPTPEDLAETTIVQLTPEIRARAAALGNDASALYAWVVTHVEYVPYHGQMQNSQAVLLSRRGNDFDQAALLIALLRAAGIPARYVGGTISLTLQQVKDWIGAEDGEAALMLLGWNWGYERKEDTIAVPHVWVETWLDTKEGKRWLALDPSFKRRSFAAAIELPRPPYDRMAYLRALKPVAPAEAYLDALRAEFHQKYPGRGFNEAFVRTTLVPPPLPGEPLPYAVAAEEFRGASFPARWQHRIRLSLIESASRAQLLEVDLSLPEVLLQSLSVTFATASAADRTVTEAFGGMENAPAAVVNLLPEIRLEGAVIAMGKKPLPMATPLDLVVTYTSAAVGTAPFSFEPHGFSAGDTVALAIRANQLSDELLTGRISRLLNRLPALTSSEATREMLYLAALRYFHRDTADEQRLSEALHMRFVHKAGIDLAAAIAKGEPQNLFDRPFVVTPGSLDIDVRNRSAPVDLTRAQQDTPDVLTAFQLHNDASSVFEHEIWEEMAWLPAVSTIKILQEAIRQNVPLRTITRDNAATVIAALEDPRAISRNELSQLAANGFQLIVPQRPVAIGNYNWFGVLGERFATRDYFFTIPHYRGGHADGELPPPQPPEGDAGGGTGGTEDNNNTTCGDPVNVSNGNLIQQSVDYVLRGPGPGLLFQRTYNSLAREDGPLGPGWRHSYQMSLKDNGTSVTVISESGNVLKFPLVKGAYTSPPAYNLTLTKDAQGHFLMRRKDGAEFRFDSRGLLLSITDRNQNAVQLSYDGGRLRQVTDRVGRSITLSYDGKGHITGLEDFAGRRVAYEYDSGGRLTAVTDLAGKRTAYAYYSDRIYNHLLKSVTTPAGRVIAWEHYGNGKVSRLTNADGSTMTFLYLPYRRETQAIDGNGSLWSYRYNALGNVIQVIRPDGSYEERSYSPDAKLESLTDSAGYTTRFTYDAAGNMTSATDPLGRTVRRTYEPKFNQVTSLSDARGNVTQYEYDARGNLTRLVRPLGVETRFTWDAAGNLASLTDAEGRTYTFTYDQYGNLAEARDPAGYVTKFEYDAFGRRTRSVDPLGGERRFQYDAGDRLVRLVNQLGQAAEATYDGDGGLATVTDSAGRLTRFDYHASGRLSRVVDTLGQLTLYAYGPSDCACPAAANLYLFRDAAGFARSQRYDAFDRLASTTDALGNTTRYGYSAAGHVERKADANGNVTTFEYDAAGQLVRRAFADGTDVRFLYDAAGNLVTAGNPYVWYTFTYDELNRMTSVTDSRFGKTIRYSYNRLGQRTDMTDPDGGVTRYEHDANQRLTSITSPAGASVRLGYDALGRVTAVNSSTLRYDAAGRVLEVGHPFGTFAYWYDAGGNRTAITDPTGWHVYQHDELNRLTGVQHESMPAEAYSYDAAGNRTGSATDPAYRYDAAARLAAAEGATLEHDKNGNLIRKTTSSGTTSYTWDTENRLVRVDLPGGGVVTYRYDPFGRRIEKNVSGAVTTYLYDGNDIILEMDAAGQTTARYTHGPGIDRPLIVERDGQCCFYHADALGSVVALTDSAGNVVRPYAYDSWGRPTRTEETGPANPFLFAGREYDTETGLYYVRARYYDPAVGRFISPDPLDLPGLVVTGQSPAHEQALLPRAAAWALRGTKAGLIPALRDTTLRTPQRLNAYAYAVNNPLLFTDPSGLGLGSQCQGGAETDSPYDPADYCNPRENFPVLFCQDYSPLIPPPPHWFQVPPPNWPVYSF